jgi:hypothetical protein
MLALLIQSWCERRHRSPQIIPAGRPSADMVMLQLVRPTRPGGRLLGDDGLTRMNESGRALLMADRVSYAHATTCSQYRTIEKGLPWFAPDSPEFTASKVPLAALRGEGGEPAAILNARRCRVVPQQDRDRWRFTPRPLCSNLPEAIENRLPHR